MRCRELSLPTLRCDLDGRIIGIDALGAPDSTTICAFLQSPECATLLKALTEQWNQQEAPEPAELGEQLFAIPIAETERRRRSGYMVAIAKREALSDMFACLRPIGSLLRWAGDDAAEIDAKDRALEEFSSKLTESYEEISLLYNLGHFMTELAAPERFVDQTLDALHATLNFAWVGTGFVSDHQLGRHMAGARLMRGVDGPTKSLIRDLLELALDCSRTDTVYVVTADQVFQKHGVRISSDIAVGRVLRGDRMTGVLLAGDKRGTDTGISSADLKLIDAAAGSMGIFLENACLYDDQQTMFLGMLEALTAAIDAKDRYTCGHSERVAHLAVKLARRVGLDDETTERLRITGLVHDVGKIGVPEAVLTKPGRLSDDEFELIKRHPEIGVRILRDIPQLSDVLPGVLHHHERWDGRGYPYGLAGEHIPLFARMLALADSFDAMSSTRTYRAAMPRTKVLDEILKNAGTQFDPEFAALFVQLDFSEFDRMVESHLLRDSEVRHARGAAA